MPDTKTYYWEREVELLPSGHRIFRESGNPGQERRWAIADESGVYPQDTDDGVLWIDTRHQRSIMVMKDDGGWHIGLPLLTTENVETRTPIDIATALRCAVKFDKTIRVDKPGSGDTDRYQIRPR